LYGQYASIIKFGADRSNRCGDMTVFRFFKTDAVRHLWFILRLLGPPTKRIVGGLYRCAKFGRNRPCSIEDMKVSMLCEFDLLFGVKMGKNENVLQFCSSKSNQVKRIYAVYRKRTRGAKNVRTLDWRPISRTATKSLLRFNLATRAKIWVTKTKIYKPRESNTSPACRDAPTGTIGLNFGVRDDIADVITRAKFWDNLFRGYGVPIPPILPFSIGIAGHPYNSVSNTVLHCDWAFLQ